MTHMAAWCFYLLGAFLTLGWKLVRYIHTSKAHGDTVAKAMMEWFFEDSVENTTSWVTTIGAVWVLGAVYIDRVAWFDWLNAVPVHNSISFFLGGLMELVAPEMTKKIATWIVAKLPSA